MSDLALTPALTLILKIHPQPHLSLSLNRNPQPHLHLHPHPSPPPSPEVVRLGAACLRRFLRRGALLRPAAATGGSAAVAAGSAAVAAGAAADGAAGAWLACFSRLLRPSLPEAAALYVPPLVALALRHAPWLFDARGGGGGGSGGGGGGGFAAHALGAAVGWLRSARLFGLQQARPR